MFVCVQYILALMELLIPTSATKFACCVNLCVASAVFSSASVSLECHNTTVWPTASDRQTSICHVLLAF